MLKARLVCLLFLVGLPFATKAAVTPDDLPGDTVWYMHADLEAMRTSESGSHIYDWFDGEVVVEVHEEVGINISEEVDTFTAFSNDTTGSVVIVEGPLTKDSQDKVLAIATLEGRLEPREHRGKAYYFVSDMNDDEHHSDDDVLNDLDEAAYFSFAVKGKAIVTANEMQMHELLDSGGRIAGSESHDGALFVLTADKSFVQAGMRADEMADDEDDDWESNILRNTEQAAVLVSDKDGLIAIEAQLVSAEPEMASAIGGIVNGLIGLQAFNSELDPELQDMIRNTKVEVKDNVLTVSTVIDPETVVTVLAD